MNLIEIFTQFLNLIIIHTHQSVAFILILIFTHLLNSLCNMRLSVLGIIPRFWPSLLTGPILAPFLHADFNHLSHNLFPLIFFLAILFSKGVFFACQIIVSLSIASGVLLWIIGRKAIHIGASSLVMGLMGYFLTLSYYQPGVVTVSTALFILYYFGTLLLSIIPDDEKTSFEGHAAGLFSGILIAQTGPLPFIHYLVITLTYLIGIIAPLINW